MTRALKLYDDKTTGRARADTVAAGERAVADLNDTSLPLPWGRKDLDQLTGGVKLGRFVAVGARPGNGKTTFSINWHNKLFEQGCTVVYISTELSPETAVTQWAAFRLGLDQDAVLCGHWRELRDGAKHEVIEEVERLTTGENAERVWFPECKSPTVTDLEMMVTDARRFGCGAHAVVFDHLHRINPAGFNSEREALQTAAVMLKTLAEDLNMAIVAMSQLRRLDVDRLFDLYRPPALGSYKGASGIEENADIALALYRPLKRMSHQEERDVRNGEQPLAAFAIPGCMVVKCLKHRYRGAAIDRMVYLSCENGVLGDWSWREETSYDTPSP